MTGFTNRKQMKRQKPDSMKLFFAFLAVFVLILSRIAAEETLSLSQIRELEKTVAATEARDQYIRWLKANPADGSFAEALARYVEIELDPANLVSTLSELLRLTADKTLKSGILAQMALTEEILGQLEKASGHYLQAFDGVDGENRFPYAYKAAQLLLEQGDTTEALELADKILSGSGDDPLKKETLLLKAKILLLDDQAGKAKELLLPLLEQTRESELYPRVLFHYIEALYSTGNEAEAGTRLSELQSLSKSNPDTAIASFLLSGMSGERIKIIQTPNTLKYLKSFSQKPKTETPGTLAYIQLGSFSAIENAQVLLAALQAKKLEGEIIERTVKEKKYYKVVMKTTDNPDAVNALLSMLKTYGYEGFLIKP
jgi:tetratricopeptide (TPR) repeat protein